MVSPVIGYAILHKANPNTHTQRERVVKARVPFIARMSQILRNPETLDEKIWTPYPPHHSSLLRAEYRFQ